MVVKAESIFNKAFGSARFPQSRAYRLEQIAALHEKAYQTYDPQPYGGRVAIVRAEHQPVGRDNDPTLGWGRLVLGHIEPVEAPGHRIGLLQEPRVRTVAERMERAIAKALDRRDA